MCEMSAQLSPTTATHSDVPSMGEPLFSLRSNHLDSTWIDVPLLTGCVGALSGDVWIVSEGAVSALSTTPELTRYS